MLLGVCNDEYKCMIMDLIYLGKDQLDNVQPRIIEKVRDRTTRKLRSRRSSLHKLRLFCPALTGPVTENLHLIIGSITDLSAAHSRLSPK